MEPAHWGLGDDRDQEISSWGPEDELIEFQVLDGPDLSAKGER
jgi:hypothetical protein